MLLRPRIAGVRFALLGLIAVAACASPPPPPTPQATSTPAATPSRGPTTAPSPSAPSRLMEPQPRLAGFRGDHTEESVLPRCDPEARMPVPAEEVPAISGNVELDVIGQLGGHPHAVAIRGDRLYVGVGPRVLVFETTPTLRQVATSPLLPGIVKGLAGRDRLLAAALGSSGLALLDLGSDAPTLMSTLALSGSARGVDLGSDVAYVAAEQGGLVTVDVRDASHPRPLQTALDDHSVLSVTASAGTLLVAAGEAGLIAMDLSDPAAPTVAGRVATGGYAFSVAADSTTAYVADGWGGLVVVDMSDLAHPRLLASVATAGWAHDVVVDGDVAFVAAGSQGLVVADVADRAAPREVSTARLAGRQAVQVAVVAELAFVVDPFDGLEVVDVASASAPRSLGTWQPLLEGWHAAPAGEHVFVASGRSGLRVLDVSDPTRPRDLAAAPTLSMAHAVAALGTDLIVSTWPDGTDPESASLLTIDASNPARPRAESAFPVVGRIEKVIFPFEDTEVSPTDRHLSVEAGTAAVVTSGSTAAYATETGLLLVGAAPSPCELGYVHTRYHNRVGEAAAVAIDGHLVFVGMDTVDTNIIAILDMSDPRDPELIATTSRREEGIAGLLVNGRWLYVLGGNDPHTNVLRVMDVGDPAHPRAVGALTFPSSTDLPLRDQPMAFAVGHLFVATGVGGLVAIDVSDPAQPRLAGHLSIPGRAISVASDGRHLYVGSDEAGMLVVDARPSGAPAPPPLSGYAGTLWSGIAAPLERPPLVVASPAIPEQAGPPDCVVTSTADSGAGSLRQCLARAGSGDAVGFDPVLFSPNQPGTIRLQSALSLNSGVSVDGAGGVVLDGGGAAGTSFTFGGTTGVTIRGLQIRGFQMGLFVDGGGHTIEDNVIGGNVFDLTLHMTSGNRVAGNYVGLDVTGTKLAHDPGADALFFIQVGSSMNLIEGNVFGVGILVLDPGSHNNSFVGNHFGVDVNGQPLHCRCGLSLGEPFNRVGGSGPGEANIFAGGNCDELEGVCSRIFFPSSDNIVLSSDLGDIWVPGQPSN